MLALGDESKIIKKLSDLKKYVLGCKRSVHPFCIGPKCDAVQCIVNEEENSRNCPFFLRFRHRAGGWPSHGHRQHVEEIWLISSCGSGDILADSQIDRQTHRRTQHNMSQTLPRAKLGIPVRTKSYLSPSAVWVFWPNDLMRSTALNMSAFEPLANLLKLKTVCTLSLNWTTPTRFWFGPTSRRPMMRLMNRFSRVNVWTVGSSTMLPDASTRNPMSLYSHPARHRYNC